MGGIEVKKRVSILICMIISVSIFVSACGIFPSNAKQKAAAKDIEKVVISYFDALIGGEFAEADYISEYAADEPFSELSFAAEDASAIMNEAFGAVTYEITASKGDPDKEEGTCDVTLTYVDAASVAENLEEGYDADTFQTALLDKDAPTLEKKITLDLVFDADEDVWQMEDTSNIAKLLGDPYTELSFAPIYPDPTLTLDLLLQALSEGDMDTASEIAGEEFAYDPSVYDEQTMALLLYYFEQMKIEVNGDPVYEDEQAELSVTVTTPDYNAAISAITDDPANDFITLMVKDFLLASINGEDTTLLEDEMTTALFDEIKVQMADPANQVSTESSMRMILNAEGDGWIIDYVSDDFIDPASVDVNSDEFASTFETAVTDAIPAALDLLLEEGSIDQATYDSIHDNL